RVRRLRSAPIASRLARSLSSSHHPRRAWFCPPDRACARDRFSACHARKLLIHAASGETVLRLSAHWRCITEEERRCHNSRQNCRGESPMSKQALVEALKKTGLTTSVANKAV